MKQHDKYMLGRKALLASGVTMVVLFALMESNVIGWTLGTSGLRSISKDIPFSRFQLGPDEAFYITIGDADDKEDFDTIETTRIPLFGAPLEERLSFQVNDNLRWQDGTSVATKDPEVLEWYRFSRVSSSSGSNQKMVSPNKILMAQYSNKNELAKVFELTKPLNRRYAEHWGHDIVFLNGQNSPSEEANLASLLELAWDERNNYDHVFLMDADGMMVNRRYDIARLLPTNQMVAAKRPRGVEDWQVYDTITLWNLNHLLVPRVANAWAHRFKEGDQLVGLDQQLKPYETEIYGLSRQIGPGITSHIRTMDRTWKSHRGQHVDAKALLEFWRKETKKACKSLNIDCGDEDDEKERLKLLFKDSN